MQPKKQLKVQYIGIFEEIDSFYWPKMHLLNEGQKIRAWVDPLPLIRAMPERKRYFSIDAFPKNDKIIRLYGKTFFLNITSLIEINVIYISVKENKRTKQEKEYFFLRVGY